MLSYGCVLCYGEALSRRRYKILQPIHHNPVVEQVSAYKKVPADSAVSWVRAPALPLLSFEVFGAPHLRVRSWGLRFRGWGLKFVFWGSEVGVWGSGVRGEG